MKALGIKKNLQKIIKIVLFLASTFGVFYGFYWMGLKGIIGMIIGLSVMAYLILSKNILMLWFIDKTRSNDIIDEINEK